MSDDRPAAGDPSGDPTGNPTGDAPSPVPPEQAPQLPPAEPTLVIPTMEPTQVLPVPGAPLADAPSAWARSEGSAPDPSRIVPAPPQPFRPYPPPPQYGWPPPQQSGASPGPQGFAGSGSYGWAPLAGPPGHWTGAPPQPLSAYPPPPAPHKRGRGWLVAFATMAAVVVVSLIAALVVPSLSVLPGRRGGPTASPSARGTGTPTTKPTASATARPTSAPTPKPTMPTDPMALLKKNPIYGLKVPANCPYQALPVSQAAFRKQVAALVACENAAWKKALAPTAVAFSKPKVQFYNTTFKSPCGRLGTTYPASYCTTNSTLYFSRASYLQGLYFRLSVAQFVFHEYAHHIQKLAGIFGASSAMTEDSAVTTRRVELQAHCIAHYSLTVSQVGYNTSDNREIEYQWGYSSDPLGHGSTKAERYWGLRGLDGKTIGACNTWSVKASRVK